MQKPLLLSCSKHRRDTLSQKQTSNTIATPEYTTDHRSTMHQREVNILQHVAKALPHNLPRHPCLNVDRELLAGTRSEMCQSSGFRWLSLPASTQRDILGMTLWKDGSGLLRISENGVDHLQLPSRCGEANNWVTCLMSMSFSEASVPLTAYKIMLAENSEFG